MAAEEALSATFAAAEIARPAKISPGSRFQQPQRERALP
jgi:hypothetical protein